MEWGEFFGTLIVVGLPIVVTIYHRRGLRDRLARIDEALDLGLEPQSAFRVTRGGTTRGCEVAMALHSIDRFDLHFSLTVRLPRSLPISVGPEYGPVRRAIEGRDLEIGCPDFDALARIDGGEVALRTLLFRRTRDALTPFLLRGGRFDGRVLTVQWTADAQTDASLVAETLDVAQALVEAARGLDDPAAYLMHIAGRDPHPIVRARTLDCLLRAFPDHARTAAAMRHALGDASPAVRRVAAVHLLDPEALQGLLTPDVPDTEQQAAVEALLRLPDGLDRLQAHLAGVHGRARAAAVAALRADGRAHDGGLALAEPTGDAGGLALHRPDPSE